MFEPWLGTGKVMAPFYSLVFLRAKWGYNGSITIARSLLSVCVASLDHHDISVIK